MTQADLKYIQKELGFTVQQMADSLNVNKSTYEYWLYGKIEIPEVYENYLKAMKVAIEQDKKQKLHDAIGAGLIALGAFAFAIYMGSTASNNSDDDED